MTLFSFQLVKEEALETQRSLDIEKFLTEGYRYKPNPFITQVFQSKSPKNLETNRDRRAWRNVTRFRIKIKSKFQKSFILGSYLMVITYSYYHYKSIKLFWKYKTMLRVQRINVTVTSNHCNLLSVKNYTFLT